MNLLYYMLQIFFSVCFLFVWFFWLCVLLCVSILVVFRWSATGVMLREVIKMFMPSLTTFIVIFLPVGEKLEARLLVVSWRLTWQVET